MFSEQYERFGFAPFGTQLTATYKNPQDTQRQQAQNTAAGRNPLGQIPGVSADRAWKYSTGDPRVRSRSSTPASAGRRSRSASASR